ncbi:Magnesium and cobalt transport protein CorA [Alloalcanivorax dieselolei B5]|uniref:Magnesium transport protein CorA n=1 Tax=Alcanivorax dieselolei (strain DSM 16502 / CGMCC 1.3690 / MCCC 1A00001 / B-5) TaxID=930169 RepID=K0CAF3_ALCDB|nr:magnesium/cobalt transporter CorA [Alloalcanivorax dieselolei]AFT70544.1 Magnesium and cobalt transport protein CorA [Alloalcanivorax dieselolei B5]GGJ85130.1 magnesium transport protein CorA [Alloalcanivorax dieselolei]
MLYVYDIEDGVLRERDVAGLTPDTAKEASWIDLVDATAEERQEVQHLFRQALPESDDVEEIESSARFFHDEHGLHVHSLFVHQSEGRHRTSTVAFVLQPGRLLTFRDSRAPDFRLMRMRIRRGWVRALEPLDILLSILEQKTENLADTLEDIHRDLEDVSYLVLEDEEAELEDGIEKLAHLEDSNGKIRLCLMDTQRSISFIQRYVRADKERRRTCSEIQHDLDTLMSHATFLFEKINFLMDSTQGFINIEQNQIIKIFSIAAVVFLPPTMIASIYGMNFQVMPELNWELGYPAVIGLMFLSGFAPYWYFKRKGWL